MWIAMRMTTWEKLEVGSGILKFKSPENSPGYIPVFNTKEQALQHADGDESQIVEIRLGVIKDA